VLGRDGVIVIDRVSSSSRHVQVDWMEFCVAIVDPQIIYRILCVIGSGDRGEEVAVRLTSGH